ncbi:MAG: tRNA (adenosine(37)-N6)-threonylcarbamoyltransferase complex dimerization subunit type 1 TsaB [Pirellulales bacterium]
MRILALETSGQAGAIAAAEGPRLLAEHVLDRQQRSARSLAPGIRQLLTTIGWRITEIELVAVTVGPGSFTGLRVGVATAKTLAYALGARCVGISTLEVIAAQCRGHFSRLSVAMDAQRGQVFAALFERAESRWQMIASPSVLETDQWLNSLDSEVAVSGPALRKLAQQVPAGVTMVESDEWEPRAATVAALAWSRHLDGAYDDLWKLAPMYLRKSAAEEKWEQKRG